MHDPLDDYKHDEPTRTTRTPPAQRPIPCQHPAFCMLCARKLTPFTWTAVDGGTFCDDCAIDARSDCILALEALSAIDWTGILVEVASVLWLSPEFRCLQFSTLKNIRLYLNDRSDNEERAAMRHLKSSGDITVMMSMTNDRIW